VKVRVSLSCILTPAKGPGNGPFCVRETGVGLSQPIPYDGGMATTTWAAFLRGINVGGNKMIPMDALRASLEKMGCKGVSTILATGNVVFTSTESNVEAITGKLERHLEKTFATEISVMLRTAADLEKIAASDPFKGIVVTKDTRLYVTFRGDEKQGTLKIPYQSPKKDFRILRVTEGEIFSVLDVSVGGRTVDSMNVIEKEFGRRVTTRNWNTVQKVLARLA